MESPKEKYEIRPSRVFLEQINDLTSAERELIAEKLDLARQNPFRYKSLRVPGLTKVFEIKLTLQDRYCRVIYTIDGDRIRVEGITNRKYDFKDLLPLLHKNRQEKQNPTSG